MSLSGIGLDPSHPRNPGGDPGGVEDEDFKYNPGAGIRRVVAVMPAKAMLRFVVSRLDFLGLDILGLDIL
jgi:hypothetical protein